MTQENEMTRRSFLSKVAVSGAALTIVPRHVLGRGFTPPSDLLNIACVGVGGMGRSNLINLASQNLAALCDVDWGYTDKMFIPFHREETGGRVSAAGVDGSEFGGSGQSANKKGGVNEAVLEPETCIDRFVS